MRTCKECGLEKDLKYFYLKPNGSVRSSYCKICYNKIYPPNKDKKKDYYNNNKEKIYLKYKEYISNNNRSEYQKEYREKNKEEQKEKNKEFRRKNKEKIKQKKSEYWSNLSDDKKNAIKLRKKDLYHSNIESYRNTKNNYVSKKLNEDSLFKMKFNIRTLIRNSFKRKYLNKSIKTTSILGCEFDKLKSYFESKFESWMTWENYGLYNGELNYGWDIDHIIPLSSAKTEEEIIKLNHYTNLQPLDSYINRVIKKHNINY